MSEHRQAVTTGIFIIVGLALAVAVVLLLGRGSLFHHRLHAIVYFEGSVRGLYVGAPVTFRGVKIGEVDAIDIDVDTGSLSTRIPVQISIGAGAIRMANGHGPRDSDLPELVRNGLRAKLFLQSVVTGQTGIDLDFRPRTPLKLNPGRGSKLPEIPTVPDRLDALLEQVSNLPLSELVRQLNQTMAVAQQMLQVTQSTIDKSGQQLVRTAAQAEKTLALGSQTLQRLEQTSTRTLDAITRLSESSRQVIDRTQPELVQTLQSTRDTAQAAQATLRQLQDLSAPGAPLRTDLEDAMRDLSQAAGTLRSFSEELERQPNVLLFGK